MFSSKIIFSSWKFKQQTFVEIEPWCNREQKVGTILIMRVFTEGHHYVLVTRYISRGKTHNISMNKSFPSESLKYNTKYLFVFLCVFIYLIFIQHMLCQVPSKHFTNIRSCNSQYKWCYWLVSKLQIHPAPQIQSLVLLLSSLKLFSNNSLCTEVQTFHFGI